MNSTHFNSEGGLSHEQFERQLIYWRQQLAGGLPVLELPLDHPRVASSSSIQAGQYDFRFPEQLLAGLRRLSQSEEVPLFVTLLSAFQLLLYRYTGQQDIVVGTTMPTHSGTNILALRTKLVDEMDFLQLIKKVRQTVLDAWTHGDLPFSWLMEMAQPGRSQNHPPLLQACLMLGKGATLEGEHPDLASLPCDIMLIFTETSEGLLGRVIYNADLLEEATISRMTGHLHILLEGVVQQPAQRLIDLSLLTQHELEQMREWNETATGDSQNQCIQHLFEAQVERTPEAVAVVYGDEHLTYHELNRRANQLAHYLQQLGIGAEDRVGVYMQRSLNLVIGLLGILKAGAAYVPLDPGYPQERLAFMLADAHVPVLLTQRTLLNKLPEQKALALCLDTDWKIIDRECTTHVHSDIQPDNLAYIIYTSGSTGQPKGVAIAHRSAVAFLHWAMRVFSRTQLAGVLASTSICFDLSIFELFAPLSVGGSIILVENVLHLPHVPAHIPVTLVNTVPSAARELVRDQSFPLSVRTINLAGEALHNALAQQLYQQTAAQQVYNLYGPSEDTTYSTYTLVERDCHREPSIGRPIANSQVYLLDAHLNLVPIGIPGEVYISGVGLARGYLNRPALTAERFIPHPFGSTPGTRLYRTGDLARYRSDGTIEYIGRRDHQVKIRGFRIELGEVESVISQHPLVRETVLLAREDTPHNKRLVAYIVASQEEEELSSAHIRSFMQKRLPEYMIPSAFVFLPVMPLTPNGKIDRRALPAPEQVREQESMAEVAPFTSTEEKLADIWKQVLGRKYLGRQEHFFEIGGHSLLATQIISQVRTVLQVELPISSFFERPTIALQASYIDELTSESGPRVLTHPPKPVLREGLLPLSFAQQRLWFLDQLQPNHAIYNESITIRFTGVLNIPALKQSLDAIVQRHEVLCTAFIALDEHPIQQIAPAYSVSLPLPIIDLELMPPSERATAVQQQALEEAQRPFHLQQCPLLRVKLLRIGSQEHILLLTMHHIISDGWSMEVFFRELSILYEGYRTEKPVALPPLPIQYADFAVWQRYWLQSGVMDRQAAYWREQLAAAPPLLELPFARPRPAVSTFCGASQFFVVPASVSEQLRLLSQREGVTLFMTLLAVFQVLLSRYTGQEDIVVGTPIANRNRTEIEGLIGFFVNTLVLRTSVAGAPTFHELLQRVRRVTSGAYDHQDLPFERQVEEMQVERKLNYNPLFQIMFILQNTPVVSIELPGLTLQQERVESGTAKFDMTLELMETAEGISGRLEYNTDLFDAASMMRLIDHYQQLLASVVTNVQQPLSHLSCLTSEERHQLLVAWNATTRSYLEDAACLHHLFEQQVQYTPENIAVVYEHESITYATLNQRANQLAHALQKMGVGPDVLVGISLDRSIEMVIALLGVLKAGGAYVPLDAGYPQERVAFMLEHAQVSILLTQQDMKQKFAEYTGAVISLDADGEMLAQGSTANPQSNVIPDNLAYVIYTSGSTGKPKGVMITQRAICNHMLWMQEAYPLTPADRVLQKTPFSFDASVWEFYAPLLVGATLVMARPGGHQDYTYLVETIADQRITTLQLVPSLLRGLLKERNMARCTSLRRVFCGGEELPVDLQEQFFTRLAASLSNLYGPTEATIDVTSWTCKREDVGRRTPIGYPISNIQVYLLDVHLQPVPIGVPGELYISGTGLARGYLKCPELTAGTFIPNPFSNEAGSRLYKTGDLAHYLPDGSIVYLGRADHQIKVRGFRIELQEIEVALEEHPAIQQSVVIAREDTPGDQRLVAYIIAHHHASDGEAFPSPGELRRFLKKRLPNYMIPAHFVVLDSLPLTSNGKVDRRALPMPDATRIKGEENYVAPRSDVERVLAEIWCAVLRLERVGIYDNFFEMGGHSLLATQVISRIQHALYVEIPMRSLFEAPAIAELAIVVVDKQLTGEQADETLMQLLAEIEQLSTDEVEALLAREKP